MNKKLTMVWLSLCLALAMLCPIVDPSTAQAQSPQPNWIAGVYTIAAGPDNLNTNLPPAVFQYYTAYVSDRVGGAGLMISNGTTWVSDVGATGATGATGPQGSVGATGSTGADGPAGLGTVTPSTPSRSLNATFTPNASKAVMACYSVNISVTNPLLAGNSSATVNLVSDTASTPTTVRAVAAATSSVGLTVTVQITQQQTTPLCYIVPANHNVRLNSSTSGTASVTIVAQTEESLG